MIYDLAGTQNGGPHFPTPWANLYSIFGHIYYAGFKVEFLTDMIRIEKACISCFIANTSYFVQDITYDTLLH